MIFAAFDADSNGYITAEEISIERISVEILGVFAPLLIEMENIQESLDLGEFIDSSFELYRTLTVTQKNLVLNYMPNEIVQNMQKPQSFVPKIGKKSKKLAKNQQYQNLPVYERL